MNKLSVEEVLLRKNLCCYPPENEAAKYYHKFLLEHPEYDNNDTKCRIDSVERQEDHYGNGGGYDNTLIIFRYREESDSEYNKRIEQKECNVINDYNNKFNNVLRDLKVELRYLPDSSKEKIIYEINKNIDYYLKNNF